MRLLVLLLPLLLASGCIGADMKEAVIELSKSSRSWCVSITTIYGTAKLGGSGLEQGRMLCNGEGWQIDASTLFQAGGGQFGGAGNGMIVVPAQPRILIQQAPQYQEVDPRTLIEPRGPALLAPSPNPSR